MATVCWSFDTCIRTTEAVFVYVLQYVYIVYTYVCVLKSNRRRGVAVTKQCPRVRCHEQRVRKCTHSPSFTGFSWLIFSYLRHVGSSALLTCTAWLNHCHGFSNFFQTTIIELFEKYMSPRRIVSVCGIVLKTPELMFYIRNYNLFHNYQHRLVCMCIIHIRNPHISKKNPGKIDNFNTFWMHEGQRGIGFVQT